jgi:hypothetical protein
MKFTGTTSRIASACLMVACGTVSASDAPPKILHEPVLGLRYHTDKVKFDVLPPNVFEMCPDLVTDRVSRRAWIYASAKESARTYYVVGGYFVRQFPHPPDYPKYELDELGAVVRLDGPNCTLIGPAQETFALRAFEDTPATVLQQLSADLTLRLTRAFGGPEQLRTELQNQHIDTRRLSPELRDSLSQYLSQ